VQILFAEDGVEDASGKLLALLTLKVRRLESTGLHSP